jgi:hypothetical protein
MTASLLHKLASTIREQRAEQLDARVLPIGINPDIEVATIPAAGTWARWTSVVAGAWLIVSAAAFPRPPDAQANAWIIGSIIVAVALGARTVSALRWLGLVAAVWLAYSTVAMFDIATAVRWNDLITALVVAVASLVPTRPRYARARR